MSTSLFGRRKKKARHATRRRLLFQQLDNRKVFAALVDATASDVETATDSQSVEVAANSGTVYVEDDTVYVEGTELDDLISVDAVSSGAGDSILRVRLNDIEKVFPIPGRLVINAGDGNDNVYVVGDVSNHEYAPSVRFSNLGVSFFDLGLPSGEDWVELHGDRGDDQLSYEGELSVSIDGSDGDDVIHGGNGQDIIDGGAGNDVTHGGAGDDAIRGGDGQDTIFAAKGDDSVHGDQGNDTIYGESGNDLIRGGYGADTIDGGGGDDRVEGFDNNACNRDRDFRNRDGTVGTIGFLQMCYGDDGSVDIIDGVAMERDTPEYEFRLPLLAPAYSHYDVNGDGEVTQGDAGMITNYLKRMGWGGNPTDMRMDVTQDGRITALDALRIINYLNSISEQDAEQEETSTDGHPSQQISLGNGNTAVSLDMTEMRGHDPADESDGKTSDVADASQLAVVPNYEQPANTIHPDSSARTAQAERIQSLSSAHDRALADGFIESLLIPIEELA